MGACSVIAIANQKGGVGKRLLGVETNITNWTRKQNQNLNYNVVVPYDMEQLDSKGLGAQAKSIIDRCTAAVYADYQQDGALPTLIVLRDKLLAQPEPEARELALSLELFTSGTLDAFAHPTNVDAQNRMVVYDIMDLGKISFRGY